MIKRALYSVGWVLLGMLLMGIITWFAIPSLMLSKHKSESIAYLSEYLVNPIAVMPNGVKSGVWTAIHITNILNVPQTVTVTLYNMDGTPLGNYPLSVYNGTLPGSAASTNNNGEISVVVQGMTQLAVEIVPSDAPHSGWGIIKSSLISENKATLIADANSYGALPDAYAGTTYNKSIPINSGNPF